MEYFLQAQYNTWLHWFRGFGFLLLLLEFIIYDDVVLLVNLILLRAKH